MEKQMDLVLCGHFALDTIIIRNPYSKSHSLGGGVTYGGLSACKYNPDAKIGIVSRLGNDFDRKYLSIFDKCNIDLSGIVQEGDETTRYQLDYHDGGRDLKLISKAPNMTITDFPASFLNAKAIHMTPIADEFPADFLNSLATHKATQDNIVGIDVQGMIRAFDPEGNILMKNDDQTRTNIFNMLRTFGSRMFFKASDKEAQAVTQIDDLIAATRKLGETGAYIFTTLGSQGLYFKAPDREIIHLNAYKPNKCVDETGAGDCFMAVLLIQIGNMSLENRTCENILNATRIASAASSFLIEKKGPHGFKSCEEIKFRVKKDKELIIN